MPSPHSRCALEMLTQILYLARLDTPASVDFYGNALLVVYGEYLLPAMRNPRGLDLLSAFLVEV